MPATLLFLFFFNDTATTEIYTLSLHDALPISSTPDPRPARRSAARGRRPRPGRARDSRASRPLPRAPSGRRSEEHTSELQSLAYLVCRLLLEKKKKALTQPRSVPDRRRPPRLS